MTHSLPAAPEAYERPLSAFSQLDDALNRPGSFGVVRVSTEASTFVALERHVARRANAAGRAVLPATHAPAAEPWRELARRLGHDMARGAHPAELAARIVRAATGRVLVIAGRGFGAWGTAVAEEVAQLSGEAERRILLVILQPHDAVGPGRVVATHRSDARALNLRLEIGHLTGDDLRRWWSAVAVGDPVAARPELCRLADLDRWWEAARAAPWPELDGALDLEPAELRALALLGAAAQAVEPRQMRALGALDAIPRLVEHGLVSHDERGALQLTPGVERPPLSRADALDLSRILVESRDGWSLMRAAELLAAAGNESEGEARAFDALRAQDDALARRDLWDRWQAVLDASPAEETAHVERLMRSAELALALDDAERAEGMMRIALRAAPLAAPVLLLHGRASYMRGDLIGAAVTLERALTHGDPTDRARASSLLAEVHYSAGDLAKAEVHAAEAVAGGDAKTRLDARNLQGKLLLARDAWQEATEHFAQDALEAMALVARAAELRAQLNRAIAARCLGHYEEARAILEEVLVCGEREGISNAVAYALRNLAAIAIVQNHYPQALALSERALEVQKALGGTFRLIQAIVALVELRLQIGLVDEAEQALRFGLRACESSVPPPRRGQFARVAAMIHFERGYADDARREIARAREMATASGEAALVAQCHRLEIAVALEAGDIGLARAALARADRVKHTAFGEAELAGLRARVARASGAPYIELARDALLLADRADYAEELREAHWLLALAYHEAGDGERAAAHLRSARKQRDRAAEALPSALRERFMARRRVRQLDQLQLDDSESGPAPSQTGNASPPREGRVHRASDRLVGESKAMRALKHAIRRVAPAEATVLIAGPTGSGKELVAEALHHASRRRHRPLVKVEVASPHRG